MQRKSVYPYTLTDPPGVNIRALRLARDWSQRTLADRCDPPMDHTAVQRMERNKHYTSNSLRRVAAALGVRVQDLFLPPEIVQYARLTDDRRRRIAALIADLAAASAIDHPTDGADT